MGSFGQRWTQSRPTKTFVFWSCVAVVIATVTIGFTWGGWVTSSTAQTTAKAMAEDAVVHRLTPICVAAAEHDPARDKKLKELGEVLDLLDNETGMHSCLEPKPSVAGWHRRQEEASPCPREYRHPSERARSLMRC
jgi:hypothetical protein